MKKTRMPKVAVIISTDSSYLDVCKIFIDFLKKNWSDCPYDMWVSVKGKFSNKFKRLEGVEIVYHGEKVSLPRGIYNIVEKQKYDYCICFLADAFITKKMKGDLIGRLIKLMEYKGIEYCNLLPSVPYRLKAYKMLKNIRYVTGDDAYGISFVAFIASRKFVGREFQSGISDIEFEVKKMSTRIPGKVYYNRIDLMKNVFSIVPCVTKGKWHPIATKRAGLNIRRINTKRQQLSILATIIDIIEVKFGFIFTWKQRRILKKVLRMMPFIEFVSEY